MMNSSGKIQALVYDEQGIASTHSVANGKQLHLLMITGCCAQDKYETTKIWHNRKVVSG